MNAPVILFVYNRIDHTKRIIESLSKCPEAKDTELFIFSDGAKNQDSAGKVQEVREYISSEPIKSMFQNVNIKMAEQNKGLANSVISGVAEVITRYGQAIVVEDDNEVSVNFIRYMNDALDFYKDNKKIWCIGGHSLKINFPKDYDKEIFMLDRGSSYAWATWADRWNLIDWEIKDYDTFIKDRSAKRRFSESGNDRVDMLTSQHLGLIDSWAIRFTYNAFKNNMFFILPRISLVLNKGNDGSGVNVSSTDKRFDTSIENELHTYTFENVTLDKRIQKEYARVFHVPLFKRLKKKIRFCINRGRK